MLIGSKAQITDLRASQGRSIIFYDPISFQPEAGTGGTLTEADGTLKINAPETHYPKNHLFLAWED
ncbi:polymorphic outer membrane protein G family protein [Chlamydia abortus]|nr:polymorphic outer membrane protein G family protein [Chlamydia abortus]SGA03865.1 polymorphic outer membrane protein G family protein [Chlamydia abortus]SGA19529.1 polymorphic outer membrane protein G family protein [Chlamydia abortus]SHD81974.1 polymorphic outer membrane protein G family protein [Chlamydia abortus]SHN94305.1 polymorphic outer membrane protein G family protein [Chlamydia abortus]